MTIAVGESAPNVRVNVAGPEGPVSEATGDLVSGKKVVLFTVPGAFTPTCSAKHLPGFMDKAKDFQEKGVGLIACVSVNDAFVMQAWATAVGVGDSVMLIADGNAEFVKALGLDVDQSERGMGIRARRAAMVLDDGVVTHLFVEPKGSFGVSSAESVLAAL